MSMPHEPLLVVEDVYKAYGLMPVWVTPGVRRGGVS